MPVRQRQSTKGRSYKASPGASTEIIQGDPAELTLKTLLALASVLALLAAAVSGNTIDNGFVYDDARGVVSNRDVVASAPMIDLWQDDFWG